MYKTQMNLVLLLFWVDGAIRVVLNISAILDIKLWSEYRFTELKWCNLNLPTIVFLSNNNFQSGI